MDKTIRKFTSKEDMRAETYRYWHSRPDWEIFRAIAEMSEDAYRDYYRLKGITPDAQRPARSLTRVQHTQR